MIMFHIPLSQYYDRKKSSEKYNEDIILKIIPELHVIRKTDSLYFLYSPLNLRVYILSKDEYNRLLNRNLNKDEERLFFENELLIPEKKDSYPSTDTNSIEPIFFFTNKCNLKCIYCFSKGGDKKTDSSFERIKCLTDFWKNRKQKYKKKNITFFSSGEPTLVFPLVKKTYDYITSVFKGRINTTLVSNGTFSTHIADWIIKNNIKLQISCDGPPYIQNFQRPMRGRRNKSSQIVEKTIKYFVKRKYKNFNTHSVITKHSLNRMGEILNYFYRLGVSNIGFADAFEYGRATSKYLSPNKVELAKESLKIIELSDEYGIVSKSPALLLRVRSKFCGAGTMLVLLENGKIMTCNNAIYNDKVSKFFTVGKYDHKNKQIIVNEKKRDMIANRTAESIKECKNCIFKWNCGGDCPFLAFIKNNTIFSPGDKCPGIKYTLENFINYKIAKEFFKIRPALEIIGNELYYSMIFNKFKLHTALSEKDVEPNSFIKITKDTDLKFLFKNIVKARDSYGYKTCVFLLSFELSEKNLNRNFGDEVLKFLKELKREKIFFVITKPLCRHLFGKNYDKILKEFKIPKNWFESVELFRLKGKRAVLINGKSIKIDEKTRRVDIYDEFEESERNALPFEKCKYCIYNIRKKCNQGIWKS